MFPRSGPVARGKDAGGEILPSLEGRRGPEELPGEKLGSAYMGRDGDGDDPVVVVGLGQAA